MHARQKHKPHHCPAAAPPVARTCHRRPLSNPKPNHLFAEEWPPRYAAKLGPEFRSSLLEKPSIPRLPHHLECKAPAHHGEKSSLCCESPLPLRWLSAHGSSAATAEPVGSELPEI